MELVFSDEFEQEGRSFYPGDDPYWEGHDLHYWGTNNLEWYVAIKFSSYRILQLLVRCIGMILLRLPQWEGYADIFQRLQVFAANWRPLEPPHNAFTEDKSRPELYGRYVEGPSCLSVFLTSF